MEANFLSQGVIPLRTLPQRRYTHKLNNYTSIHAVATTERNGPRPAGKLTEVVTTPMTTKTVYIDGWFDQLAMNYLSQSVQATTGIINKKNGYQSLVQAARDASKILSLVEQREAVLQALNRAVPKPLSDMIKMVLPQSKFKREFFAAFTTVFFVWLIGPSQVQEAEIDGRREKNVVHIKKCRFLEEANCVGMCTNLCKIPTQTFIKEAMGMPVNMVPNFDDMSCEMIFGQDPPPLTEDPAMSQPCYTICKLKQRHGRCFN